MTGWIDRLRQWRDEAREKAWDGSIPSIARLERLTQTINALTETIDYAADHPDATPERTATWCRGRAAWCRTSARIEPEGAGPEEWATQSGFHALADGFDMVADRIDATIVGGDGE